MSNISPLFAVEAEELLKTGRAQEAIDLCKQGIEVFPNYSIAYGILARAHSAIGDTAVAESVLENAAQHFPRSKTIRKIVDLSHSGDINQILHEFEEKLEKKSNAKNIENNKKPQSEIQIDTSSEVKESDLINELIEDIEYERFAQKSYQEKIFNQAEISDLKLIFSSEKIDAYVLPFKANFVVKNKRSAHFTQDNFMFPPLFFDIKFNPEQITSPLLKFNDETDDFEKDMFFDDAIATFNTSLSMNKEIDKLNANQEKNNEENLKVDFTNEIDESLSLNSINQNENIPVDNEIEIEHTSEASQLPYSNVDIDNTHEFEDIQNELNESESLPEVNDIVNENINELDIFEQIESPILEETAIEDKYTADVDIMAMIEELENPNSDLQSNADLEIYEPNAEDLLEQELLSDFEIVTDIQDEEIEEQSNEEAIEDLVGDIFGKIITDDTPRNLTIEQIGNQLSNFEADEIEEVEEENYSDFASETIAEIFAEQGAYTNAIKMYTKLIDQEPEKAEYFLSRIEEIKLLKNQ